MATKMQNIPTTKNVGFITKGSFHSTSLVLNHRIETSPIKRNINE